MVAGTFSSRRVVRLALPATLEGLLVTAVAMVSLTIVDPLGPEAIASVALANQINAFALMGVTGLAVGTSVVVAHYTGAREPSRMRTAVLQGWLLTLVLTGLMSAGGWLAAPDLIRLLGGTPELVETGVGYLRWLFVLLPLVGSTASLSASWRGFGNTGIPMLTTLLGNGLFILLGMWLVPGGRGVPPLGIDGLAWAYGLGHASAAAAMLWTWLRPTGPVRPRAFVVDWPIMRRILQISIPSAAEKLALSGGQLMFLRTVTSLGVEVYAAHSIMLQISNVNHALVQGSAVAVSTLVGQSLGAGDAATAKRTTYGVEAVAAGLMALVGTLQFASADTVARAFTTDGRVIEEIARALPWLASYMPMLAVYSIVGGGLRGAGDTRWTMTIAVVGIWVFRLPVVALLVDVFGLGLAGIWMSMAIDFLIRAALAQARMHNLMSRLVRRLSAGTAGLVAAEAQR